jgi:hypothetical protein
VLHREQRRDRAVGGANLGVDVLDVVIGGLRRDAERQRDLSGGVPDRDQPQDLDLARVRSAGAVGRFDEPCPTAPRTAATASPSNRPARTCPRSSFAACSAGSASRRGLPLVRASLNQP